MFGVNKEVENNTKRDIEIDTKGEIAFKLRLKVKECSQEKIKKSDELIKERTGKYAKNIPDSIVKTMIQKFLDETVLTNETDLNRVRRSKEEQDGDLEWNVTNLVRHKLTKEYDKMLYDRYGDVFDENNKDDFVPVAFYFNIDFIGAHIRMDNELERYINLIAVEFAKRGISIIIGDTVWARYQIDKIPTDFTAEDLKNMIHTLSSRNLTKLYISNLQEKQGIILKKISKHPKEYWKEKRVKKLVVFDSGGPLLYDASDAITEFYEKGHNAKFKNSIKEFSKQCEIWWFEVCSNDLLIERFENTENMHHYKITKITDLKRHLDNINSRTYEKEHRQECKRIRGGFEL